MMTNSDVDSDVVLGFVFVVFFIVAAVPGFVFIVFFVVAAPSIIVALPMYVCMYVCMHVGVDQ